MNTQYKNWCFTDFELLDWEKIYNSNKDIVYVCWGKEKCPLTDKIHNQGWLQMGTKKRMEYIKKNINKKIHIEPCKGTAEDNNIYCQKDKEFKSLGVFTTQGERTDLDSVKEMIDNGESLYDVGHTHFKTFIQYNRGLAHYKTLIDKRLRKDFRQVEVTHIWGETGCGKTRKAMEGEDIYKIQGDGMKWWDGYEGESTIVIDEYNNSVPCTELLGILDGYQLRLPIKGGFTYANWTKVIITSNFEILHDMARTEHHLALKRRITNIIKMCRSTQG